MICPVSGTAALETDEEIRVNKTELAVAQEANLATIDAGADDEVVIVMEHGRP